MDLERNAYKRLTTTRIAARVGAWGTDGAPEAKREHRDWRQPNSDPPATVTNERLDCASSPGNCDPAVCR